MARLLFIVLSNPAEGREDTYNDWYSRVHVPDVLKVDGVVAAERLRLVAEPGRVAPWKYAAIYEWDVEDVSSARSALARAKAAGELPVVDDLDRSTIGAWFFEPLS